MNVYEEHSRSLWLDDAPEVAGSPGSPRDTKADVIVVGAGIAGLSVAYELTRRGRSVVVLDRGALARGMTARTTAHLVSELDDDYCELVERRGEDVAQLFAESQRVAIDAVETIVREAEIDCDFARVEGFLFAPDGDQSELDAEYEAARNAGMRVSWAERAPILGVHTGRCLRFADQARIHPLKYLAGLARAIRARGGRLFADTPVKSVKEKDGGVVATLADGDELRAACAVIAANTPFNDKDVHGKQTPYRTYAMAFEAPKGAVADALLWDTLNPYHYVRIQPGERGDTVIVGGEDHRTGMADDAEARFAKLETWARQCFPEIGAVTHRWSGQVYEPADFLPFIGASGDSKRVFVVSGDSGQGMTMGATAGLIIPDLLEGRDNRWVEIFKPSRKVEKGKDGADLKAHVAETTRSSVADIAPGEGALVQDGEKVLATYRSPSGELHVRSAACTHMGCVVHWNSFETCWDCPCHGSQFSAEGEVLQGPALAALEEADAPEEKRPRREERPRA